jgi:hypothetical protein
MWITTHYGPATNKDLAFRAHGSAASSGRRLLHLAPPTSRRREDQARRGSDSARKARSLFVAGRGKIKSPLLRADGEPEDKDV